MFDVDMRIEQSCMMLGDWPLSRVFLKNIRQYPWFILVPRKNNIRELFELEYHERMTLMEEINQLSRLVHEYYSPKKLNIGALGNIVSQLHIHVVARTEEDDLWPHGIWQSGIHETPYDSSTLNTLLPVMKELVFDAGTLYGTKNQKFRMN